MQRRAKTQLVGMLDVVAAPFTAAAAIWLSMVRRIGLGRMPVSAAIFRRVGVVPVRDHYYEPLVNPRRWLVRPLSEPRSLTGVNLNIEGQLQLLASLKGSGELDSEGNGGPVTGDDLLYQYSNHSFGAGDSDMLYGIVRTFKPRRIVEIGSGMSTRAAHQAVLRNQAEDPEYLCEHVCIEPFEMPWLERLGVVVIRERVELVDRELFRSLDTNDVLFIDSSHVIRPQGDVLVEYLEILPALKHGVLVHVHDIFTPRDYPASWICEDVRLWNEQYLLEAMLCDNERFEVLLAGNHLKNDYPNEFTAAFPSVRRYPDCQPGGFWIRRR